MKFKAQSAVAVGIIAMSIPLSSLADSAHSLGPSYVSASNGDLKFTSPGVVYEYKRSETMSIEIGLNSGGTDEFSVGNLTTAISIDSIISTKLKFSSASEGTRFFGSIGFSKISGDVFACNLQCAQGPIDTDGLTAGIGVDFDLGEKWHLGGQYSKGFGDLDGLDFMGLNLLYTF